MPLETTCWKLPLVIVALVVVPEDTVVVVISFASPAFCKRS
jgi:hypothetical protein